MPFGRRVLNSSSGIPVQATADGNPEWKTAGITLDWSKVAAVGSDTLLPVDQLTVPSGQKYLRFGQVMTRISNPSVQTFQITGTPTGGTFTVTGTRPDTQATSTQTVAYNATVAAFQTAMDAIFGAGNTLVSGAGALPANTLTITAQNGLQYVTVGALLADLTNLTGGTPASVITVTNAGTNTGMYGPYDPAAADGRQTLAIDLVGILNATILQTPVLGFTTMNQDNPGLIVGGRLYYDRILWTTGTHSLAAGPTVAELRAVMPRLSTVQN